MNDIRLFSISAVERETGLSKDVLRKWETRYGFPEPRRSDKGERLYPGEQLTRLRLIKRLMDSGMRPADIVGLERSALEGLAAGRPQAGFPAKGGDAAEMVMEVLRRHDVEGLRKMLRSQLLRSGVELFVLDKMPLLNDIVGEAWARGDIQVFEEHLYTEVIHGLLREAIGAVAPDRGLPRVLLTTPPGELHTLGILMADAILSIHGAQCICLGAQTPVDEIVKAVSAFEIDIVGLSFSIAYPARQIAPLLAELRAQLPENVSLWAGGAGTARQKKLPAGTQAVASLAAVQGVLADHLVRQPARSGRNGSERRIDK